MIYNDKKVSDIQIAYIGGGSMGWAWTFMADLSLEDKISGTIRLLILIKRPQREMRLSVIR